MLNTFVTTRHGISLLGAALLITTASAQQLPPAAGSFKGKMLVVACDTDMLVALRKLM